MPGLIITRNPKISVTYTADQWELFTCSYPTECEAAAVEINRELEFCVNSGMTRFETENYMEGVMDHFSNLGAQDSEPRYHLQDMLDEIYE
jgi:hypothetical protein